MSQFRCSTHNSLRALPPSRDGLTEHIKRDCLEGGFEWRTLAEDRDFTDRTHWGWGFIDNKYITKWHEFSDSVDVNYLTQVCYFKKDCVKIASVQKTRSTVCFIACVIGNV